MKEIYLLSGLGADKRVFDFIDFSSYKTNHVEWIPPIDNESIEDYAKRLLEQIKTEKPILIGVSFGGMMATEIGKLIVTEKIILISSSKTKSEIPIYFRFIGSLHMEKTIPTKHFKKVNELVFWLFGTETKNEKELLKEIINDTDEQFLKWAIAKIVTWKNKTVSTNTIHIHGTNDKILPMKKADFVIQNGGHLMIINKGKEISELLQKIL